MYFYVDYSRFKTFLKKIIKSFSVYFLVISLVFVSTSQVYASTSSGLGGWKLGNAVRNGATSVYSGSKNVILNGATYVKNGSASLKPTPAMLGKFMRANGVAFGLSLILDQILGGVDYVFDPANNTIQYRDKDSANTIKPTDKYYYQVGSSKGSSPQILCEQALSSMPDPLMKTASVTYESDGFDAYGVPYGGNCALYGGEYNYSGNTLSAVSVFVNPAYDPQAKPEEQDKPTSIPISDVSTRVIGLADEQDAKAIDYVGTVSDAAVADVVEGKDQKLGNDFVNQLEGSGTIAEGGTGTGTITPSIPQTGTGEIEGGYDMALDFPVFCGWASIVCEAANVVITAPTVIAEKWELVTDWAGSKKDDDNDHEKEDTPDIDDVPLVDLDTSYFKASKACPAPQIINTDFGLGGKGTLEISYEPICNFAEKWSFVSPLIAFLSGAMIIIGVGRKGNDDDS